MNKEYEKRIEELEKRITKLAQEKARLSLLNEMFANFERTDSLDGILDTIINDALSLHGGQNVIIYYLLNNEWYFKDISGNKGKKNISEDDNLQTVIRTKNNYDDILNIPEDASKININLEEINSCTSYFPMVAEEEVLAILVLENRLIYSDATFGDFSTFFNYAGIVLKGEIDNIERLNNAQVEFDQIFQRSLDGILLVDKFGIVIRCNQAFRKTFKFSEANVDKNIYNSDKFQFITVQLNHLKNEKLENYEFDQWVIIEEIELELFCIVSISALKNYQNKTSGYIINVKDITTRQKVREELAASNKRISIASEAAKLGFFEMDLRKNTLEWDDTLCDIYGYDQLSEKNRFEYFNSILHPEDHERVVAEFKISLESGAPDYYYDQYRIKVNNKQVQYIKTSSFHERDETGKVHRIIGASQDISEQKFAELQIRESEERYRLLHESAGLGIGYYSVDGNVISYNEVAARNMSGKPEDFVGMSMYDLFPEDLAQEYMRRINSAVNSNAPQTYEDNVPLQVGEISFLSTYTKISDNEDKILGIQIISQDITEQKRVQKALNESQERHRSLLRNLPVGVYRSNLKGRMISANIAMAEIFGYNTIGELMSITSESLYHQATSWGELMERLLEEGAVIDYRTKGYRKDGVLIWVSGNYRLIVEKAGPDKKELMIDAVISDITQKKKNEEELIIAKEQAEESGRLKSAFLANMSHEIRTPMNGILGFMDLLDDSNITASEHKQYLGIVKKSGDRLLQTINDIIELSKIEAGETPINENEIDVISTLHFLVEFFKPEVKKEGIELRLNLTCPEITVITDAIKLESILTNLIKNAIKFTNKGFVEIGFDFDDEYLQFYVKDTGKGIPKSRLGAIFDRFVQADLRLTRGHEGSGLGLSISRAYVEMLGGEIHVESELNVGTTFIFYVKKVAATEISKSLLNETDKIENKKSDADIRILIAEDDEVSFSLMKAYLDKLDYSIVHAKDGEEAVDFFNKNNFDLIFMDLKMPKLDGLEATRIIKSIDNKIPIIAQTAFALSGDRERAIDAGCVDYMAKPIKKNDLFLLLKKYTQL